MTDAYLLTEFRIYSPSVYGSWICVRVAGTKSNGYQSSNTSNGHQGDIDLRTAQVYCDPIFSFGQPGSVSKFPPFLWVKLWVGWVGRGYTEISRYFPASWINWVTLVTKKKLLYSLRFYITFESPKMPLWYAFFASQSLILCAVYDSSPSSHVRSSLIGWLFMLGNTDCNTVPTWWM